MGQDKAAGKAVRQRGRLDDKELASGMHSRGHSASVLLALFFTVYMSVRAWGGPNQDHPSAPA
jgi:hypothetical protein